MKRTITLTAAAVLFLQGFQPLTGQDDTGLPSVAEATAISQATGRPILAMAGQKT